MRLAGFVDVSEKSAPVVELERSRVVRGRRARLVAYACRCPPFGALLLREFRRAAFRALRVRAAHETAQHAEVGYVL